MLTFDPNIMDVIGGKVSSPFAGSMTLEVDAAEGRVSISATTDAPEDAEIALPRILASIAVRLTGSAFDPAQFSLESLTLTQFGAELPVEDVPVTPEWYLRGDALADGVVDIFDALFIAQCLAEQKPFGTNENSCNPVNAASVRQDGDQGDRVSIKDALFIAQYLVDIRYESFD